MMKQSYYQNSNINFKAGKKLPALPYRGAHCYKHRFLRPRGIYRIGRATYRQDGAWHEQSSSAHARYDTHRGRHRIDM